ncbi:MAG: choice-of-anchor Q domain-containing protein [Luteolibacter sp.]
MKIHFLAILAILTILCAFGQMHGQILSFGDSEDDVINSVAYDSVGNVFYTGEFFGTVDFDPSNGQNVGTDTFTGASPVSGFVCSYTSAGVFRFAFPLAGGPCIPEALSVTLSGDIIVTGGFAGTIDFDPGSGVENRTGSASEASTFVSSYSNAGAFQSTVVLGSSGQAGIFASSVVLDSANNRYIAGTIEGTHDMDPSGATFNLAATSGNVEAFVASYAANGTFRFARLITDDNDIEARDLAVDPAGNSFIVGEFNGTCDFDDSDGPDADDTFTSLGPAGTFSSGNGYVASYSPTGAFRFAFPLSTKGPQEATGVAVDGDGNFYVTGQALTGTDFDPGPAVVAVSEDEKGAFLASYTNTGTFRFASPRGELDESDNLDVETGNLLGGTKGMTVAARGDDIYVGGVFSGLADFAREDAEGLGLLDTAYGGLVTPLNEKDIYLVKFHKDGGFVWARSFDTQQTAALVTFPYGAQDIAISPAGQVSIVGSFEPNAPDLDPGINVASVTGGGKEDAFAIQLESNGYLPGSPVPSFEVTNTADTGDGSLRRALEFANHTPATDTITFNIPGTGPHTILPQSPLPEIIYPLNIDGLSQPGASAASWPPDLRVVLNGSSAGTGAVGFDMSGNLIHTHRYVRGLVIQNFDGSGLRFGYGYRPFTVTDCFIGTNVDGTTAAPNGTGIADGSGDVGSSGPNLPASFGQTGGGTFGRNLISGNSDSGLNISDVISVHNNFIGTAVDGVSALPNGGNGIGVSGRRITIGGTGSGEENVIAHNGLAGIRQFASRENRFYRNSIHGNGGLGIELFDSTPLPNDVGDRDDQDPNNRNNHPIINKALLTGGQTLVEGFLDGIAGGRFRLEFFSTPSADPSGYGEGKTFLGFTWVEIKNGPAEFSLALPPVTAGHVISATATADERSFNGEGTSEFSPAVTVLEPNVTTLADAGAGSLRQAITDANGNPGPDTITLAPDLANQVLIPDSDLPPITGETSIVAPDGFTISGGNTRRALTINAPGEVVTLTGLTIEDGSGAIGGGILHIDGTLNLFRCVIRHCTATGDGGGLAVQAGVVNVEDTTLSGNHADGNGGGIARLIGGDLNVDRALLIDNSADVSGGGGYCTGGVFNESSQVSTYLNTTFIGNTAPTGGAFRRAEAGQYSPRVTSCTIVENTATITDGGVSGVGTSSVKGCIIAMNTAPANPDNAADVSATDNFIGGDPLLGPLRDNGGYVLTRALLTGSPAIDPFAAAGGAGEADARRAPRSSGDRPDQGAFEYYQGPFADERPSFSNWASSLPVDSRGELDDPNGDGVPNLVSMYFGLYGLGSNNGNGIRTRRNESGNLVIAFSIPIWILESDLSSTVLVADQLPTEAIPYPWTPGPVPVELGSTTANIDYEVEIPVDSPKKFVVFEVTNGSP